MRNSKVWLLLLIIPILFIIRGIQWGIPVDSRLSLLFPNPSQKQEYLSLLAKDISNVITTKENLIIPRKFKKNSAMNKHDKIRALTRFLLFSEHPDEMLVISALSTMSPCQLKFDPHEYTYGMPYFIGVGVSLICANLLHQIVLTHNPLFYLKHPHEIGKMYVVGRLFNLIAILLIAAGAIYFCLLFHSDMYHACLCACVLISLPSVITYSLVLKPHIFAAAFALWTVIFCYQTFKTKRLIFIYLASICVGIGMSFQYTTATCVLFPIITLYFITTSYKIFFKNVITCIFLSFLIFTILNPYLILNFHAAIRDISHTSAMHKKVFPFPAIFTISMEMFLIGIGAGGIILLLLSCIFNLLVAIPSYIKILKLSINSSIRFISKKIFNIIIYSKHTPLILTFMIPLIIIYILISSFTAAEGLGSPENVRFFLLLQPIVILFAWFSLQKCLSFLKIKMKNIIITICALLTLINGYHISNVHYQTCGTKKTFFKAGKWINSHISNNTNIYLLKQPAPFSCPIFNLHNYNIYVGKLNRLKKTDIIISYKKITTYKNLILWKEFSSKWKYFRISFAEQHYYLYKSIADSK